MGIHSTGDGLSEGSWELLLERIKDGNCTPFLGAGASANVLPTAKEMANEWATKYNYPLNSPDDLASVAQFLATEKDGMYPRDCVRKKFEQVSIPNFDTDNDPHAFMADLNLPIYITTNYDNFMAEAIKHRKKTVEVEFSLWNEYLATHSKGSIFNTEYNPTPDHPLVYHLHGTYKTPKSMVLTECDYIDFMINYVRKPDFLPSAILGALASSSLLFVGYSLNDMNFRILFRSIMGSMGADLDYSSVAVQLDPKKGTEEEVKQARAYLDDYFDKNYKIEIDVYWGKASDFLSELHNRWNKAYGNKNNE